MAGLTPMAGDLVWASTWRERYAAVAADAGAVAAAAAEAEAAVESAPADAAAGVTSVAAAVDAAGADDAEGAEGAEDAEGEGGRAWAPAALPPAVRVLSTADVSSGLFRAPRLRPRPSLAPPAPPLEP